MGKGDKKTKRGKIVNGSYGRSRRKKKANKYVKPVVAKAPIEEKVETVETVEEKATVKKAVVKKTTAKKTAVKKVKATKTKAVEPKEKAVKKTVTKKTTTAKTKADKAKKE